MRPLSPREQQVLVEMLSGEAIKDTAKKLGITAKGVKFHRHNIFRKFDLPVTYGGTNNIGALLKILGHFELRFVPNEDYLKAAGIKFVPIQRAS